MRYYWFVSDFNCLSNAIGMEKRLIEFAKCWEHHVIREEDIEERIIKLLKYEQEAILIKSRLKRVEIKSYQYGLPQYMQIYIGSSTIKLIRVENSVDLQ